MFETEVQKLMQEKTDMQNKINQLEEDIEQHNKEINKLVLNGQLYEKDLLNYQDAYILQVTMIYKLNGDILFQDIEQPDIDKDGHLTGILFGATFSWSKEFNSYIMRDEFEERNYLIDVIGFWNVILMED